MVHHQLVSSQLSCTGHEHCTMEYPQLQTAQMNVWWLQHACYVPYHRSNSISVSTRDAPQMHSWSSNITSRMLPFSIRTIPVLAQVLWHPTINEITITLSFGTSLVNGLRPPHASLLSISDYGYTQSRYHMIQFPLPQVYFISPYACFILPCGSLYLIFLLPCAHCHITNPYVSALII